MPVYYAGFVNATGLVRFGTGFTVTRVLVAGSYKILLPQTRFFAFTVTPEQPDRTVRVRIVRDGVTGLVSGEVEIRNSDKVLVDGDFSFVALERS
jgi:hypothetical protein